MKPNMPEDVWKFVRKGKVKDCWIWVHGKFRNGYGRFTYKMKAHLAHRFIYELVNGKIKPGLVIMHKCNRKLCCNPSHLLAETTATNARHASSSGAFKSGSSGIVGVGFYKTRGYWWAQGWKDGKRINLYTGPHFNKAVAARKKWENDNLVCFPEVQL